MGFNEVIGPGMLQLAVDLAEVTADANVFVNVDSFHASVL